MLNFFKLDGFRSFHNYSLNDLARVNLIVGKNNSGKTSLLEALQLYLSKGSIPALTSGGLARGEIQLTPNSNQKTKVDLAQLFAGRNLKIGSQFTLDGDSGPLRVSVRALAQEDWQAVNQFASKGRGQEFLVADKALMKISITGPKGTGHKRNFIILDPDGKISFALTDTDPKEVIPLVRAMTTKGAVPSVQLWADAVQRGTEGRIIELLRIIEPKLENLFFFEVTDEEPLVLVGIENEAKRFPLGSFGDGMKRLLDFALRMERASGRALLIDEIDSGLHYSIIGDIWKFITAAAVQLDIQIFATTHSLDCIRGLAHLCENYPALGAEVSLQKISPNLEKSVSFGPAEIIAVAQQEIEVR